MNEQEYRKLKNEFFDRAKKLKDFFNKMNDILDKHRPGLIFVDEPPTNRGNDGK